MVSEEHLEHISCIVRIHFSETSKETMSDKTKRMLRNEVQQMQKNDNHT